MRLDAIGRISRASSEVRTMPNHAKQPAPDADERLCRECKEWFQADDFCRKCKKCEACCECPEEVN